MDMRQDMAPIVPLDGKRRERGPGKKAMEGAVRATDYILHHNCAILGGLQKFPDIIAHPSRHFPASKDAWRCRAPEAAKLIEKQWS